MMYTDVRWKQRFENFDKAFTVFNRRIAGYRQNKGSEAEQMALVQSFEIVFELAWKVLKDYLENEGLNDTTTPKKAIMHAFQANIITDAQTWVDALKNRNLTTHTYNQATAIELLAFIEERFSPVLQNMHEKLKTEI